MICVSLLARGVTRKRHGAARHLILACLLPLCGCTLHIHLWGRYGGNDARPVRDPVSIDIPSEREKPDESAASRPSGSGDETLDEYLDRLGFH